MTGQEIRRIREGLSLSQVNFANKIGLTSAHLSRLERGKNKISRIYISKIEELMREDPERLIGEQMGRMEVGEHAWHTVNAAIESLERSEELRALMLLRTLRHFLAKSTGHEVPE